MIPVAQVMTGWQSIVLVIVGLLGGTSVFLALVLLTVRGYWGRYVAPLIQEEIKKWFEGSVQMDICAKKHLTSIKEWYDHREQRLDREKELQNLLRSPVISDEVTHEIKSIIDNEIKRTDGLISKEIQGQVSDMESRLMAKLEEVTHYLKEDTDFKQTMIQRMSRMEGAINTLLGQRTNSLSSDSIKMPTKDR